MLKDYIAVIQAGGKGTRLLELTKDKIPKPLLKLNNKPMLEWQIDNLKKYGVSNFIIIVGHLGNKIKEYFGNGEKQGIKISYIEENEPLGSAGALYYLKEYKNSFLLIFGDVMFDFDIKRMIDFHEKNKASATLLVHPNSHPFDSDLIVMDKKKRVINLNPKNSKRDYWYDNCVNAGIYILSKEILNVIEKPAYYDLEKDILVPLFKTKKIYGYETTEYIKDAGTIERFRNAEYEQKSGIWELKNLNNPQKCIFLDRDGTINNYNGLIADEKQLELEKNASQAIKLINESGYLAIAVTNQPVVARGMCSIEDVCNINRKLTVLLGENNAYLDDIIFCPHHPDKGFPEENPEYKIVCNCRKPSTGMIDYAVKKYNIDINQSYIIGDSTTDIQTGINAGLRTVLVHTGQAGQDKKYNVTADFEAADLLDAVKRIIN